MLRSTGKQRNTQKITKFRLDHFLDGIWLIYGHASGPPLKLYCSRECHQSPGSVQSMSHILTLFHISQRLEVSTAPFHRLMLSRFIVHQIPSSRRPLCQLCTLRFLQVAPIPHSSADLVDSVQLQITFFRKKRGGEKAFQKTLQAV